MPLIQSLVETVEELLREHEHLLQLAEEKKRALINGDMEKLQEIVNKEIHFIRKVEKLEELRIQQGKRIADEHGMKLEELTASKLAELESDPERTAKINLLTGRFLQVIGEVKAANELNGKLLQQSLELVQRSISLMTDVPDSGTYTGRGDSGQATSGQRRFFDTKA
ncbi:flagellar protein FlgN [Effusibacillus consociatus]|uniref:Flagellar protein FlgN n=1 Tax=Effusibacillus consociatus TaxID=1117041 RepID=A0ABV9Q179_9BACL